MKEIKQYKCELCGTLYAEKSECEACEKQHVSPKRIKVAQFKPRKVCAKYPPRIVIEFEDGTVCNYERGSIQR